MNLLNGADDLAEVRKTILQIWFGKSIKNELMKI